MRIVVCQDGNTLPAARAEIGTGLCHVYLSLHTVHRPGLQLGVCMTNYEPYVHLHIHLCCQIFVYSKYMVLRVFWKLEFLSLRYLGSRCGIQRLINISELDTLLETAHNCKTNKKKA